MLKYDLIVLIRGGNFVGQKTKTVYFCAGWFTDNQNKAYKNAMAAIKENPTVDVENSYVPLEHQYKGLRVD